jgi:hypothetical protein
MAFANEKPQEYLEYLSIETGEAKSLICLNNRGQGLQYRKKEHIDQRPQGRGLPHAMKTNLKLGPHSFAGRARRKRSPESSHKAGGDDLGAQRAGVAALRRESDENEKSCAKQRGYQQPEHTRCGRDY